ncbi:MAG: sulfatase [Polyangiaceae bacterium]
MSRRLLLTLACLTGLSCNDKKPPPGEAPTVVPAASAATTVAVSASAASPPPAPSGPDKPLNVLLITIDSLRADMPWQGYERPIAPNLSKLAEQSVVYTQAYSPAPYTAQTVAAWLSGRYASTLYRAGWFFAAYAKSNTFFTEVLQSKGIRTLGWHGHMYFGRGKGLDQGFDEWQLAPGIRFDPNTDNEITSEKLTKLGIELLSKPENTSKQFFGWVHYMDPHDQYNKHPESPDFGNKNRDRYDNEIHHTDKWIAEFFAWGEKQPWWKNTAIIVTGDHGEAFGEHSMWKHAFEVWEVLVRTPLLIHVPGVAGKRIDLRRNSIDLAPTIMELMGQKPLEQFQGKSMVKEIYGAEQPDNREPIVVQLTEDSHNPERRGVILGDYKLIVWGKGWKYLLFNLKTDPGEENDLAKKEPEKLEEMKKVYEKAFEKLPFIEPYGGMKLKGGTTANGPMAPAKAPSDKENSAP